MKKSEVSGYKPRHKGVIETCFCENGCLIVDGIMVPFPDCNAHGSHFKSKQNVL